MEEGRRGRRWDGGGGGVKVKGWGGGMKVGGWDRVKVVVERGLHYRDEDADGNRGWDEIGSK